MAALGVDACARVCARARVCMRVGTCLRVLLQNRSPGSELMFYLFPKKRTRPPKKPQPPWELASW